MDRVWIKPQLAEMTLGPSVWLAGCLPEAGARSLLEEGDVTSASYHRQDEEEKGYGHRYVSLYHHLFLLGLCSGSELVGSPELSVYDQRPHRTPGRGRKGMGPKLGRLVHWSPET